MKALCHYNTGIAHKDCKMPDGFREDSKYNLEIGKEYPVMGICFYDKVILYLIDNEDGPDWYPSILFVITDHIIDKGWYYRAFTSDYSQFCEAVMGYKELCLEEGHWDDLLFRMEEALSTYYQRKNEIYGSTEMNA